MKPYLESVNNHHFFILDSDIGNAAKQFKDEKGTNKDYYLIDEKNHGYIEKILDQQIVKNLINENNWIIDPEKAGKNKERFQTYLEMESSSDSIKSIDSYIVYKEKLIKKEELATRISKIATFDYSGFENMFENIKYQITNTRNIQKQYT